MKNYFRITAYNPTLDVSYIVDSVDKHENIGQFCVAIVKHSRIIEGSTAMQFDDGTTFRLAAPIIHSLLR